MEKSKFLYILNSFLVVFFLYSLSESFTYYGFWFKHFGKLVYFLFFICFVSLLFFFRRFNSYIFANNFILVIVYTFTIFYVFLISLEKLVYPNFVFSHFHLHPDMLILPLTALVVIFFINQVESTITGFLNFLIFFLLLQYILVDLSLLKNENPVFVIKNLRLDYDEKMRLSVGKLPYDYAIFIKNNTPKESVILIPPQGFPWPQTGNGAYLRYFIYPRKLINGKEKEAGVDLSKVDFVLLDYGESNASEYGYTNYWPKFDIPSEYIIYWNPGSGEVIREDKTLYRYDLNEKDKLWGLIKVDKSRL